jgi:hypothetical protein
MVLYYIANCTGLIVKGTSALDAEIFSHGDLYALDMSSIPERLKKGIREPRVKHVVDRALAEVVIDAKDR